MVYVYTGISLANPIAYNYVANGQAKSVLRRLGVLITS